MDDADSELDSEVISLVRHWASEAMGGNCAFCDDDARVLAALAQRAVLAGLAVDFEGKTLDNMRRAAESRRDEHERSLGFPIAWVQC